jgi:hypothetical protein
MMQLQSPTYTKGITESTILVGEPAIHGNPDMGVLQNGMAATECFMHHTIAFLCGFGCRVKGHSNVSNSIASWESVVVPSLMPKHCSYCQTCMGTCQLHVTTFFVFIDTAMLPPQLRTIVHTSKSLASGNRLQGPSQIQVAAMTYPEPAWLL